MALSKAARARVLVIVLVFGVVLAATLTAVGRMGPAPVQIPTPDLLWLRYSSGTFAHAVAADSSGLYVAGVTSGADAFLRKYVADGTVAWTREFGTSERDVANAVGIHPSGIYVVGSTSGTFPEETNAGDADAFMRKYDTSGTVVWTRQF